MARRYRFICSDNPAPSGGAAVIYDIAATLAEAGYDAALVHLTPGFRYAFTHHQPPALHDLRLAGTLARHDGRRARLRERLRQMRFVTAGSADRFQAAPGDVLIVPEFLMAEAAETYPDVPRVVFSQNPFSYLESVTRCWDRGIDPNAGVVWTLGVSDSCMAAIDLIQPRARARITVGPNLDLFPFSGAKRRQIALMPRKRGPEARLIQQALVQRGRLDGFEFVSVDRLAQPEVGRILGESLIFLSLMHNEGLGFPGIEAMSAGCIVVGYTGLAAQEYLDAATGFPVAEGDTPGMVAAVERVIATYARDPAPLDALRRHASDHVRDRYSAERFRSTLLSVWHEMDARISADRPFTPA